MRRLHQWTEQGIVAAVKYASISIKTLYSTWALLLYYIWLPIRETGKYIGFIIATIYKRYAYEWYLLFTINVIWMGILGYLTIPKLVRKMELGYQMPLGEIITFEAKEYLYSFNMWPFTALRQYTEILQATNEQLTEYKIKAGELPEAIDVMINREAYRQGIPEELVWAIIKKEGSNLNPHAFFAGNRDRSLDTGIMQVNSKNFDYCGITIQEAFNPVYNVRCGMKILKDAYKEAQDLAARKRSPKSCTNADSDNDLIIEYTGRIYNGGSGVFSKGRTSCKYAQDLRLIMAGIEPLPEPEPIIVDQVAQLEEEFIEEETGGFWSFNWLGL